MRTRTFNVVRVTLAAAAVASGCIRKEEKEEKAAAPAPAPAPPAPPPEPQRSSLAIDQNATYTVVAAATNKCLQFAGGGSMDEQALAEIAACNKSAGQQFKLQPVQGNYWSFVNVASGKCLDVQALSMDDGGLIQQFSCNAGPNQQWIVADAGPGAIRLVSRHSGKVLDVKDSGTTDGTKIVQMAWKSAPNEHFKLVALGAAAEPAAKGAEAAAKPKKEKAAKTKTQ